MSQPQEPRTGGVAVTRRYAVAFPGIEGYAYRETRQPGPADGLTIIVGDEPGTWFPLAEAESLIDAKRDLEREVEMHGETIAERDALIDPNDPAVRERVADVVGELAGCVDGIECPRCRQDADAVLAALRGAK